MKVYDSNNGHNTKTEEKLKKMTTEPVEKLVLSLAAPAVLSMLITTIYNMADTYYAGKINSESIAVVGVVYSFMSILQAFGFLYGHGSGNFLSKILGMNKIKEAENMAGIGVLFSLSTGILAAAITLIFQKNIAYILGANENILEEITSYLKMLAFGIPFIMCGLTINNIFRFQGNSFYGMIGIILGGLLNIILDPIFMFNMGIKGAGLATSISQMISFFFLLYLNGRCGNVKLSIFNLKISSKLVKFLYMGGAPNFARQTIGALAVFILNWMAISYGETAVAAFTVVNKIVMFLGAAMIGFGQGFQPVCGYNFGAGLFKRVKKSFYFCVSVSTIFFVMITVICEVGAEFIVSLFTTDLQTVKLGVLILKYQCISIPIMGWIIMSGMFLQNIGLLKKATIVSAARQGILFIPLAIILKYLFGIYGIMLVQPLADIGTFLISLPMTITAIKNMNGESLWEGHFQKKND